MQDIFITKIEITQVRNIRNLTIPLSDDERKHLIITGKNGSGKTSLLNEIRNWFYVREQNKPISVSAVSDNAMRLDLSLNRHYGFDFTMKNEIFLHFGAQRIVSHDIPSGISKLSLDTPTIGSHVNSHFLQYIVNLQAERSFANTDHDTDTVNRIDQWFSNFEKRLCEIFQVELKLEFDRKNYNFNIVEKGKLPFTFNTLPDGYAAIMSIVSELIMRIDDVSKDALQVQGIVLIDEIEAHLHIDLQKRILPFLTEFFPNIQFVVTTHSPFVISSLSNAVVCDLEKNIVANDLSAYSYEAIIESYFDSDQYSEEIKSQLSDFEALSEKGHLTEGERDQLKNLHNYFNNAPKVFAPELEAKLQQIKLKRLLKTA